MKKDLAKFNQSGVLSGLIFSVTSMVSPLAVHNSGVLGGLIEKMRQSFEEFSKTASSNQPKLIEILRQELSAEALAHSLRDLLVALEEKDIETFLVLKLNLCEDFLPAKVEAALEAIETVATVATVATAETTVDVAEVVAVSAQALEDAKGVDSAASSTSSLVMDETVVGSREAFNDEELPTDTRVSEAVESSRMGAGSALPSQDSTASSGAYSIASSIAPSALASAPKSKKTANSFVLGPKPLPKGQTPTPTKQARKSAKEVKKSEPVDDGSYAICNARRRAHKHGSEMSYKKYTSGFTNEP